MALSRRFVRRRTNSVYHLTELDDCPDQRAVKRMAAFDELTPAVRAALDSSICDFSPHQVLDRLRTRGEHYCLSLIRKSEQEARANWHAQSGRVLDQSRRSFGGFF